jgi:hypothetical protein
MWEVIRDAYLEMKRPKYFFDRTFGHFSFSETSILCVNSTAGLTKRQTLSTVWYLVLPLLARYRFALGL